MCHLSLATRHPSPMSIAFRKVWRDLWNHKGRTLLVVLSIAVGVLALGMTTASSTFLNEQMDASRLANRSPHVRMALATPLDDEAVAAVARMPQVAEAEGWITANIRWKAAPGGEWKDAVLTALADYEDQKFDRLEFKSGDWPG